MAPQLFQRFVPAPFCQRRAALAGTSSPQPARDERRAQPLPAPPGPLAVTSETAELMGETILSCNPNDINPWGCDLVAVIFYFFFSSLFDDELLE